MKKILMIIGGIVVGLIALIVIIFTVVRLTSQTLACTSDEGNITLMFNDRTIRGFTARGMGFNLDEQRAYAEQIGMEAYIEEFSQWFSSNTTGTCVR